MADDPGDAQGAASLIGGLRDELADLHGAVVERAVRAEGRAARAEGELAVKDALEQIASRLGRQVVATCYR